MSTNISSFAYMENGDYWFEELKKLARPERWEYVNDPTTKTYPILRNYINHTYKRLNKLNVSNPSGNYFVKTSTLFCFNTGLFSINYEPIFALFVKNDRHRWQKWKLKGFFKESSYELRGIDPLPERATYFNDISDLFYDTRCSLRINIDHILDDEENRARIPEIYRDSPSLAIALRGMSIHYAEIRIKENYKAAVPQYFNDRIQFLVPISLGDPKKVDLALAVKRDGSVYTGKTCLTLDMAYNNARLIARPETDWLA